MKVILLCGYRTEDSSEEALGLERDEDGVTLIDRRIQQLGALGLEIICVLSGNSADRQLRHCTRIANVELAYDDDAETCLASNLRAGLAAVEDDGCFVLPIEIPCPPSETWENLKELWRKVRFENEYAALQLAESEGALCQYGFPLLITQQGNQVLRDTPQIRSLVDARLKYLRLAPQAKPI